MMFITLMQVLQVPRRWAGMAAVMGIWFYVVVTGFPTSAIRAAIMATIVIGGWIAKRPSDLMNSLFAAALVILLWDPQQLFQPGFQLSFVVVLCILLILPMIHGWMKKPFEPDPFLPRQISSTQFWHGDWIANPRTFLIDTFAISLAAWLGSIPLAAYYFHVFNIVSTPANWVVVPLTALALISCLGSLLVGWCLPGTAALFNHAT
jgi:competence protein ComEC